VPHCHVVQRCAESCVDFHISIVDWKDISCDMIYHTAHTATAWHGAQQLAAASLHNNTPTSFTIILLLFNAAAAANTTIAQMTFLNQRSWQVFATCVQSIQAYIWHPAMRPLAIDKRKKELRSTRVSTALSYSAVTYRFVTWRQRIWEEASMVYCFLWHQS